MKMLKRDYAKISHTKQYSNTLISSLHIDTINHTAYLLHAKFIFSEQCTSSN